MIVNGISLVCRQNETFEGSFELVWGFWSIYLNRFVTFLTPNIRCEFTASGRPRVQRVIWCHHSRLLEMRCFSRTCTSPVRSARLAPSGPLLLWWRSETGRRLGQPCSWRCIFRPGWFGKLQQLWDLQGHLQEVNATEATCVWDVCNCWTVWQVLMYFKVHVTD